MRRVLGPAQDDGVFAVQALLHLRRLLYLGHGDWRRQGQYAVPRLQNRNSPSP